MSDAPMKIIKEETVYVYDIKEDKNYEIVIDEPLLAPTPTPTPFAEAFAIIPTTAETARWRSSERFCPGPSPLCKRSRPGPAAFRQNPISDKAAPGENCQTPSPPDKARET